MSRDHLDERQRLMRDIDPNCALAIIPGAGHWVPYEAADAFNTVLRGILLR
jgi:pimeloyl-ACP methyl ester carboxylesterase